MKRQELANVVIWPAGSNAIMRLLTEDGEPIAEYGIQAPVKGSELAKLVPEGMVVDASEAVVVRMTGKIVHQTKTDFETIVVTERAEKTLEERIQQIERSNRLVREREERERQRRQREHDEVMERLRKREAELEVVEVEQTVETTEEGVDE